MLLFSLWLLFGTWSLSLSVSRARQEDTAASTSSHHADLSQALHLAIARAKLSGHWNLRCMISILCDGQCVCCIYGRLTIFSSVYYLVLTATLRQHGNVYIIESSLPRDHYASVLWHLECNSVCCVLCYIVCTAGCFGQNNHVNVLMHFYSVKHCVVSYSIL